MAKDELELMLDHLDSMTEVAVEHMKGKTATEIAKELKIPRQRVVDYVREWKGLTASNEAIRSRAREALAGADAHYSKLIGKAYEVMDEADSNSNLSAKLASIKQVVDIEAKRIDMLQKSGMLENKELAEEMMETQRKQDALETILKEVVADCSHCRTEVMSRLSAANNSESAVVIKYTPPEERNV